MEYITAICSVLAVIFTFFTISREGRDDLRSALLRSHLAVKSLSRFVLLVLALLFPVLFMGLSIDKFWQFNVSTDPITRHEVMMLFVHFFNLVSYFIVFIVVLGVAFKAANKVKEARASREGPAEPSESE